MQSRKEDEGMEDEEGGWSGGVSSGRLSRSVYLSGKEARKRRSFSLSLFFSLASFPFSLSLSFFLCLSISDHFFQPSPPCDLALPSLVHPLLSLHEAMFRYNLFRREILIGLADFKKNC